MIQMASILWSQELPFGSPYYFDIDIKEPIKKLNMVMKADGKLLRSELDYVKKFLKQQFGVQQTRELMKVFKEILDQDYPLRDICRQIQRSMDHPSRLELIHILYGLSAADGDDV